MHYFSFILSHFVICALGVKDPLSLWAALSHGDTHCTLFPVIPLVMTIGSVKLASLAVFSPWSLAHYTNWGYFPICRAGC